MGNPAANLLIIDDEQETLDLLRIAMEKNGFHADTASCWEEVTRHLENKELTGEGIDLILLDIMMPGRSGFDILRALQVVLVPLPPVIILSAVTGFEQQLYAREMGVAKYITKPTTPQKLIEAINEVLSGRS
jgi:DNA-binding response OmpR family regulator